MSNLSLGRGLRQTHRSYVFSFSFSGIFFLRLNGKKESEKSPPALLTVSAIAMASVPFIVSMMTSKVTSREHRGKDTGCHISGDFPVVMQAFEPAAPGSSAAFSGKIVSFFIQTFENPPIIKL